MQTIIVHSLENELVRLHSRLSKFSAHIDEYDLHSMDQIKSLTIQIDKIEDALIDLGSKTKENEP